MKAYIYWPLCVLVPLLLIKIGVLLQKYDDVATYTIYAVAFIVAAVAGYAFERIRK